METTEEVIYEDVVTNTADEEEAKVPDAQPTTQDDYQLMNVVRGIKEASRQEVQVDLTVKDARIKELEEQLLQTKEQLEPLLKFESILAKNINEPMSIRLYVSDNDKEKLLVLSRDLYPKMSNKFDSRESQHGRERDPLNQMMSDFSAFMLIGPVHQCMMLGFFKNNKQRGLVINDK